MLLRLRRRRRWLLRVLLLRVLLLRRLVAGEAFAARAVPAAYAKLARCCLVNLPAARCDSSERAMNE